jgi:hypothetical protein
MALLRSHILMVVTVFLLNPLFSLLIPRANRERDYHPDHNQRFQASRSFFRHVTPYSRQPQHQTIGWRNQVALKNIFSVPKHIYNVQEENSVYRGKRATSPRDLHPGDAAPPFSIVTTDGPLRFPYGPLANKPVIIHTYDKRSGFLEVSQIILPFI